MNYEELGTTIKSDLHEAVALINNPEIDPEVRRLDLEILFREVGDQVYDVIYAMNAWDMDIEYTEGVGINDFYYGLAKNVSDSISVGGASDVYAQIDEWLANQIIKAQLDAFETARQSGKFPTVTRIEPADCCEWCSQFKDGLGGSVTYVDPSQMVWARHDRCKGRIITSGYKTNNGEYAGVRRAWVYRG